MEILNARYGRSRFCHRPSVTRSPFDSDAILFHQFPAFLYNASRCWRWNVDVVYVPPTKMESSRIAHVCLQRLVSLPTILFFLLALSLLVGEAAGLGEIIYAVNSGGDGHTDTNGIHFQRDPLHGKTGTPSDFGKQLLVGRVSPADMILYQTERYHTSTFGYDIPVKDDGNYVLVLKFCEVYFTASHMKVFHVALNNEITVISDLDIYDKVGRGIAYDEVIPFTISKGKLKVNQAETPFSGKLRVDFMKGPKDNPKINAIYVMRGTVDDVPKLPPLELEEDLFNKEEQQESRSESSQKNRRPSGPRNPDPYSLDESSTMLPIFVAIVAFIPILFCLCKL